MGEKSSKITIVTLAVSLGISLCANLYGFYIDPLIRWKHADAVVWYELEPALKTGALVGSDGSKLRLDAKTSEANPEITPTPVPTKKAALPSLQYEGATVYVTKSGKKFHRETCSSLSKSKIPILYEEAIAKSYDPCGKCNP